MSDPLLLIHGAWQGSWSFDALLPALEAVGLRGVAVDLPGNGADDTSPQDVTLDCYLEFLTEVIDDLGGRVSIVGHSGGGLVATAMAERSPQRIASVIYLAGMCLPNGEDFGQLQERIAGPGQVFGISADIVVSADGLTSTVPAESAIAHFLDDCDPELARDVAAKLTPQPEGGRLIASPTTAANFGRLPKLYIEARRDRSVILPAQRAMQELAPDMAVVSLDTGHVPHLTDPTAVVSAISSFLRTLAI